MQVIDQPIVDILSSSTDYLDILIRFPANPIFESGYSAVFNENIYNHPADAGVPDLPVLIREIEFPFGSDYSVEILDSKSTSGILGENGLPTSIPDRAPEVEKCDPVDDNCEIIKQDIIETPESTPTETPVVIPTETPESSPTGTPEATPTETPESSPTGTPEATPTGTPEATLTGTPEATPTGTPDTTPTATLEESTIVSIEDFFPASPVQLINTYVVRGHQVGQLQFWPVQYSPTNQTVLIYQELTLRINIHQADMRVATNNSAAYSSSAFESLLSSQIINYNQGIQVNGSRSTSIEPMIIIAPDAFISGLTTLVNLKQSQGHPVTLVGLSTTGSTPQAIKSYIQSAYTSWSTPPSYVLLVGDVNNGSLSMPAFIGSSSQTVTDLYYGTVDGSDWIPDIFVGRLPARNTTQLNTMINNLVAYNNLTGTEEWIKKAAFLASNDSTYWQVAEDTQDYVIQNRTLPKGYTGSFPSSPQAGGDKLYAHTYSAGNSQVVNAINNRRSLISYSGHGSRTSWGGPSYSQTNIRNISSTGTFSVVTSFACITGDYNITESFSETWMLQPNKGAVTFIGSSSNSYWGPDDILERAMMNSLYNGTPSANIVSSFRFAGLMAVHAARPGTGTAQSRYYWESYNLLGDPSLAMVIDAPVLPDYLPQLNTSSVSIGQAPGQDTNIRLVLTNAGSMTDSYSVDLTSDSWVVSMQTRALKESLAPGESTIVEITISIPADAPYGQTEQFVLSVTSVNDPDSPPAKDTTTIRLMSAILSFIPIVSNP